ncbi:MAG: hypothetical protein WD294_02990 [Phycisphaeraceae bacterium]
MSTETNTHEQDVAASLVTTVGVELDVLEAHVARWVGGDEGHAESLSLGDLPLPPSVVLPRFAGEGVQADVAWPVHPRSTGDHWPPEARVSFAEGERAPARMPMAYAWPMLAHDLAWQWEPASDEARGRRVRSITAADAVAHLLAGLRDSAKLDHAEQVVVVPTYLQRAAMDALREAAGRRRLNVRLVSGAVAAAMGWIGLQPKRVENRATVLALHLGLDAWEASLVNLTREGDGDDHRVRGRVQGEAQPPLLSVGMEMMHRVAERAVEISAKQQNPARVWELMWCTPWLRTALNLLSDEKTTIPRELAFLAPHVQRQEFLRQQCRSAMQRAPGVGAEVPALMRRYRVGEGGFAATRDWVNAQRKMLSGVLLHGAIVTGPLAHVPYEPGRSFGEFYLQQFGVKPAEVVIEGRDVSAGILSRGAALWGRYPWDG